MLTILSQHCLTVLDMLAEALDSCKKVENQLMSLTAVGIEIEEEAMQEATSTCQAAEAIIQQLLPAVIATLRHGEDEVAMAVVPFLVSWVARLKANQKRTNSVPQVP